MIQVKLWCVHVQGPDTVIAQPDEATARRRAKEWALEIKTLEDRNPGISERIVPVAAPWPHSAEGHAEELAKHGGEPEDVC